VSTTLAPRPRETQDDRLRKKRLGQYFTPPKVARLLAALAGARAATAIVDPMVGRGDMLGGCASVGATASLAGIDIDRDVLASCRARVAAPPLHLVCGSAFSPATIRQLPQRQFALVITNPPYVRYQSTSALSSVDGIPTAPKVRDDLLASLSMLPALDATDARYLRAVVQNYSGLADLAVPSWLLCAALTEMSGTLAMLVPTAWLTRDYAHVVRYVLARWFDVKYVVEDSEGTWFDEALVRTSLVIARRVPRRTTAFAPESESGYLHVRLDRSCVTDGSLVGKLFQTALDPDVAFAEALATVGRPTHSHGSGATVDWVSASQVSAEIASALRTATWLDGVADRPPSRRNARVPFPAPIRAAIGDSSHPLVTLCELGWNVGQGLRTGANQFFYVEPASCDDQTVRVRSALIPDHDPIPVPADALAPVLRRQSELPDPLAIDRGALVGHVLYLDRYADPQDLTGLAGAPYKPVPAPLARYLRVAATVDVGTSAEPRTVPRLSAVATNVRRTAEGRAPRFWYQLPPLRPRHQPALLLARVNTAAPRTYLNPDAAIIDANFSTLWPNDESSPAPHAVLAALNSTLCTAQFELLGTVLGAGALKLEATHVRRVLLPVLTLKQWNQLTTLGQQLADCTTSVVAAIIDEVDQILSTALGAPHAYDLVARLRDLSADRQRARLR
jgi:tRNA G10  N-methylase Trm11